MNRTHLEHAVIAVVMQLVLLMSCVPVLSPVVIVLTALPPLFFFFAREHAQAEKKLQTRNKDVTITWQVTLEALCFWKWSFDAVMDFVCPLLACGSLTILWLFLWR